MLKEFKEFAIKGSMIDLAVGVIIGGATINYGSFITGTINLIIMAFVVFLIVRSINKMRRKEEPAKPVTVKNSPYCYTVIHIDASRCPNCTSELE